MNACPLLEVQASNERLTLPGSSYEVYVRNKTSRIETYAYRDEVSCAFNSIFPHLHDTALDSRAARDMEASLEVCIL